MPTPNQIAALLDLIDLSVRAQHGVVDDAGYLHERETLARRVFGAEPQDAERSPTHAHA